MHARTRSRARIHRLRTVREDAGLTREQLAVKAGISSSTLYLAERAGLMSPNTARKIAAVLRVPAEDLQS
jgi:DNA-binding XRE family transcriptional regulator